MRRRRPQRRAGWDVERLRRALEGEGIDTRTWVACARVDDDTDAIRWDTALGWIVDVTIQGGPLNMTGPIACRLGTTYVADGGLRSDPPTLDTLVAIAISEGSPNASVIIVGTMPTPDRAVPSSVNGQTIDEDFAKATHILVTAHDVQQEVGEKWRTSATSRATLEAPEVRLASEDADQSAVKGNAQKDALDQFNQAFATWAAQVATGITSGGGVAPPSQVQFIQAFSTLGEALSNALSTKVKLE